MGAALAAWVIDLLAASDAALDHAEPVLIAAVGVAAAGACLVAARAAAASTWLQPWPLLGVAIVVYAANVTHYSADHGVAERFPSFFDVALAGFYPLLFVALVLFVRPQVSHFSRSLWIDAGVAALATMALGTLVVEPQVSSVAELGQLLYLLGDLAFLGFLLATWGLSGRRSSAGLLLLSVGALLLTVADAAFVNRVANGALEPGAASLALWPAALIALAAASISAPARVAAVPYSWANIAVPVLSAAIALPITLLSSIPDDVAIYPAVLALGLVVVRMTVGLTEHVGLLRVTAEAAIVDPLTGLANRKLLVDRITRALARNERTGEMAAVLFLDLDDFKSVNDSHGHEAGDKLLNAAARRICRALRSGNGEDPAPGGVAGPLGEDTVARLGGDEFVVLIERLSEPANALLVAERILDGLRTSAHVDGFQPLEASIGITLSDGSDGRDAGELLRDADIAMYEAKKAGRSRYELFGTAMREEAIRRTRAIHELRRAIGNDELTLFYQPQVDLEHGGVTGVEALVRWRHPEEGILPPARFIPIAESHGLITSIDDWVLAEACRQMAEWQKAGIGPLNVAVNVSAGRLVAGDLAEAVERVARETGADVRRLEVEVTETVAVEQEERAIVAIQDVRELGVSVAIDDFGMGHSALSRLNSFPIDRIKIDRSFISSLTPDSADGSLAAAMIAMANSLGLGVIAEGVESEEHLMALLSLGCTSAQGFHFSKPIPAGEIATMVRAQARPAAPAAARAQGEPDGEERDRERLVRSLLVELGRLTGLESIYVTRVEPGLQRITHARNTGTLEIPEGLSIDWHDTVCRRALEQGVPYTEDVGRTFPDASAAADLGLKTYIGVPIYAPDGELEGTLCGASSHRITLGSETLRVMQGFARRIARRLDRAPGG